MVLPPRSAAEETASPYATLNEIPRNTSIRRETDPKGSAQIIGHELRLSPRPQPWPNRRDAQSTSSKKAARRLPIVRLPKGT